MACKVISAGALFTSGIYLFYLARKRPNHLMLYRGLGAGKIDEK